MTTSSRPSLLIQRDALPFAGMTAATIPRTPFNDLDLEVASNYMGDYDGLTSDFTGKTAGFIGAFQWMSSGMNPDVKAFSFQ